MGFEVRSELPGLDPEAKRALVEVQGAIKRELDRAETRGARPKRRVTELVEEGHVIARPGEVVRVQPGAEDVTVYLPEPGPSNGGEDIVVSFEGDGTAAGKVLVAAMNGTCAVPGVTTLNSPGQYRYTSVTSPSAKPGFGSPTPSTGAGTTWSGPPPIVADDLPEEVVLDDDLPLALPLGPIYDVRDYGAIGNGSADDTAAIQAAINACALTGGIVYLGRAHKITSTLVISGDGIWVRGRGIHPNNGTKIAFNGSGSSCKAVQVLGYQHSGISDVYIESSKVYSSDALLEFDGTFRGFAINVSLTFGYNSIHIYRSTETWISWFQIRNPFGTRGVLFDGTASVHSYRCILENAGMDCPYPFAISGHGAAWTASNAVVQGSIRHNADGIWSCSQAGTTSGAGTGPAKSSITTTNPTTYRATDVTDGTAKWRWVSDRNLTWVALDSYASTLTVSKLALISGGVGVRHSNTVGGSGARGDGIIATDLEIDHAYDFGIFLEDGYDAQFHGGSVTSMQFDAGVRVGAAYGVDWTIEGLRIFGCAKHGVSLAAGYGKVQNNRIGHNGTLTSNTYDGISIDDGVGHFVITGNTAGELGYGGNAQRTGIQVNGTLGDNYAIVGNNCVGNLTNAVFNGPGSATTRVVRDNVPDTTTGIIPDGDYGDITVSSSGTVWNIDAATVGPTELATTVAGNGLTGGGGSALAVGAGTRISVAADTVSWTGLPLQETGVDKLDCYTRLDYRAGTKTSVSVQDFTGGVGRVTYSWSGVALENVGVTVMDATLLDFRGTSPISISAADFGGGAARITCALSDGDRGDITVSASGATWTVDALAITAGKIAADAVTTVKILDANVTDAKISNRAALSVFGRSANSSGVGADIAAGTDGHVLRRSGTTLGFGTIATAGITDAAVTLAKQADLAQSRIIGRAESAGTGVPQALTPTQVVSIIDGEDIFWTGANEWAGSATFRGSARFSTVATATLAAQQNDFTAGHATVCKFTLTGSQNLSGIVPDSVSEGCLMAVVNADDTDNLTLLHNSSSSSSANRFFLPGNTDRTLIPRAMALLWYNTDGRWHMVYAT